jgi:hypothetical protein
MTDLDHLAGGCSLVTLSNEKASAGSGHVSTSTAWLEPSRGRSRPTYGRLPILFPAGLAGMPLPRPYDRLRSFTLTASGSDDGLCRHP